MPISPGNLKGAPEKFRDPWLKARSKRWQGTSPCLFFSHPDFHCRYQNRTGSAANLRVTDFKHCLSPSVGIFTLPRRNYLLN